MLLLSNKDVPFHQIIPQGYVDIHSHLLPGIDDGTKTIYQSTYILEQFEKLGMRKVITTPHVLKDIWPNSSETILKNLKELKAVLSPLGVSKIKLHASAEYMMDDLFFTRLKNNDILPLHQDYILVEMSTFSPPINLKEIVFEIKLAGYIPILAHPERYSFYENNLEEYDELKNLGFLFQLNLLSLSGYYGGKIKSFSKKLINLNYFDFAGTDVHNYHQLEILKKGFNSKIAKKITPIMKNNLIFS
ncbi:tyrosine-protein phosphatase [Aquimarina muelleri]|uniref:tyrosine-protein phosphatase n=1 Tax=Aquimarina muelleri TaxID=279356 RepID=UPI00040055B4|nr:CpsB/CapC family capsule biosynthesis tyrosine phosphatase [Aquimarina muelleri]MCX2762867.1 histidinol phosphatase [Aquimarina muelleri]